MIKKQESMIEFENKIYLQYPIYAKMQYFNHLLFTNKRDLRIYFYQKSTRVYVWISALKYQELIFLIIILQQLNIIREFGKIFDKL